MSAMTREVKCECGHSVTRHGPRGCSAYVLPRIDGSQTCCSRSPSDIVAAREAAAREAVLAEVEALAAEWDRSPRPSGADFVGAGIWAADRENARRLRALVARLRADA